MGENATPDEVVPSALMVTLELLVEVDPPGLSGSSGFFGSSEEHEYSTMYSSSAMICRSFFIKFVGYLFTTRYPLFLR